MKKGDKVRVLQFFYVGVAHIFGYREWNGETYRLQVATLGEGSWFGDYQILTDLLSSWDLVAGGDHEFDNSKKAKGVPPEHILVYAIEANVLRKIVNQYPAFQSFLVTRSMARRSYFT